MRYNPFDGYATCSLESYRKYLDIMLPLIIAMEDWEVITVY